MFTKKVQPVYLITTRLFIEGIVIFLFTFYNYKKKFVYLSKRYQIEQKRKTIFLIILTKKMHYYFKVMLYSFMYGIGIFILPIIILSIKEDNKYPKDDLTFCFYMIMTFEFLFLNLYTIMFYPQRFSILLFYPFNVETIFNTNFISEFREKKDNISRLTKEKLKNTYQKNNFPIVLLNPFCSEKNFFSNLNVGYVSSAEI